jgi:hypothetical protein
MQPKSPGSDEQPSAFAELTIIKLPVLQGDPALQELPSGYAELTIIKLPVAPGDPAPEEEPSAFAELTIIRMPLLPGEPEATFYSGQRASRGRGTGPTWWPAQSSRSRPKRELSRRTRWRTR